MKVLLFLNIVLLIIEILVDILGFILGETVRIDFTKTVLQVSVIVLLVAAI